MLSEAYNTSFQSDKHKADLASEGLSISLVYRVLTDGVALQHSSHRRTFQEEQARILAATNSMIAGECNKAVFESTLTPSR